VPFPYSLIVIIAVVIGLTFYYMRRWEREMTQPTGSEELCRRRGYHRWLRLVGGGYQHKKIYKCEGCLQVLSKNFLRLANNNNSTSPHFLFGISSFSLSSEPKGNTASSKSLAMRHSKNKFWLTRTLYELITNYKLMQAL
jgi:hypothetical protein